MPPEYVTKGDYEKREAELREDYNEKLFKLRKQIQEQSAREEERVKVTEKMLSRLWMERVVYISIIIGAVSILVTIIMML